MNTTERFTGKAEAYAKYRPTYPSAYFDYLLGAVNLTAGSAVADVGAGTGIFTRQLLERGLHVTAVEPNADMRAQLMQALAGQAGFAASGGSAEATELPDASVDLVTAAQAFHWFNPDTFKLECRRILKPGSKVALVWNGRDRESALEQDVETSFKRFCPTFRGFSEGMRNTPHTCDDFFGEGVCEYRAFREDTVQDIQSFLGRNVSASYAPRPEDASYGAFVKDMTEVFERHSKDGKLIQAKITHSYVGAV